MASQGIRDWPMSTASVRNWRSQFFVLSFGASFVAASTADARSLDQMKGFGFTSGCLGGAMLSPLKKVATAKQPALILRTKMDAPDSMARAKAALPAAKFLEAPDYAEDLFDAAPKTLAKDIGGYLSGRV